VAVGALYRIRGRGGGKLLHRQHSAKGTQAQMLPVSPVGRCQWYDFVREGGNLFWSV